MANLFAHAYKIPTAIASRSVRMRENSSYTFSDLREAHREKQFAISLS
jgi:hypothetical protein